MPVKATSSGRRSTPPGRSAADRDDVEVLWIGLPEPIDLHLDVAGTLVWTDQGDPPDGTPSTGHR
jgi:hypothetical protein